MTHHAGCGRAASLLRSLPPVLRARDFHLYLEGNRRLTDLWQYGGAAVLGHKPPRMVRELKNALERGLLVPFPHPLEKRFLKALGRLFPDRCFRIYADEASLRLALAEAGFSRPGDTPFPDPAFPCTHDRTQAGGHIPCLWRPFLPPDASQDAEKAPILLPVLPWPLAPLAVVIEKDREDLFPQGDFVSPALLAAAARTVHDLIAAGPEREKIRYRKIEKALSLPGNKWRRRGIYLTCDTGLQADQWAAVWNRFLEKGFLLPPSPADPLILPGLMSPGEEAKLAGLLEIR